MQAKAQIMVCTRPGGSETLKVCMYSTSVSLWWQQCPVVPVEAWGRACLDWILWMSTPLATETKTTTNNPKRKKHLMPIVEVLLHWMPCQASVSNIDVLCVCMCVCLCMRGCGCVPACLCVCVCVCVWMCATIWIVATMSVQLCLV